MQNNNETQNNEDKVSAIADSMKSRKVVSGLLLLVLVVMVGIYKLSRTEPQQEQVKNDTYQVENVTDSTESTPVRNAAVSAEPKADVRIQQAVTETQMKVLVEKEKELQQRLMAPLMIVNASNERSVAETKEKPEKDINPNMRFMEQVSEREDKGATASAIGSLGTVIAQGSFIHAIMEPATNSDLPGYLRAIVSEPSYSEDGVNVLIPRGSRLIGEYKSGMLQGQSRIFIVWSRLITPSGLSVQLGSAGVDSLGVSGIGADIIDRHFWQRFGTASLLSIIGAGAANVGVSGGDQSNSASTYRGALASSFSQTAGDTLQQDGMIAPTLKTYQGKPIMVFVARDLKFGDAIKKTTPSINVF